MENNKISFCSGCKVSVDYALSTMQHDKLFIQINKEASEPEGSIIIPLCECCRTKLYESLGIDGFTVMTSE